MVVKVTCSNIEDINQTFLDQIEDKDESIINQTDIDQEDKGSSALLYGIVITGKVIVISVMIFLSLRKLSEKLIFDPCSFYPSVVKDRILGRNIPPDAISFESNKRTLFYNLHFSDGINNIKSCDNVILLFHGNGCNLTDFNKFTIRRDIITKFKDNGITDENEIRKTMKEFHESRLIPKYEHILGNKKVCVVEAAYAHELWVWRTSKEKDFINDAKAILNHVVLGKETDAADNEEEEKMNEARKKLLVVGESIGSYPSIIFTAEINPMALILDCAFISIDESFIKRLFPKILHVFLCFLVGYKLDNLANIEKVASPILFIHASNDNVCPSSCSNALYNNNSASSHSRVIKYIGNKKVPHLNPVSPHWLYNAIKSFIDSILTNQTK